MAVGGLISNVLDPFGFNPSEISFLCLGLLGAGVAGAVIAGAFLDRTKLYKVSMHSIMLIVTIVTGGVVANLHWFPAAKVALCGLLLVGGFFSTGYYPLCIAYGGEITFPVQPVLVNGMFTVVDGTASFLLSLLGGFLIKEREGDE